MTHTLVTADVHFSDNPRDEYRFKFLEEWLPRAVIEHDVKRLLILGDICEAKDAHRARLVNRIVDGLVVIAEDADVILMKGNHDYLSEDAPFFRFTQHLPRVRWINQPTRLKLRGLGVCMFLPHTNDCENDWRDLAPGTHDWTFCHQTFDGADVGHGHTMAGISRDVFARKSRVISGDIHVPQKLGSVTYTGAPYTVDFGDDYEPRVLLLSGDEMTSVPVEGPQKKLVTVRGRDPVKALNLGGDHPLGAALPTINASDVVKVRVELDSEQGVERAQVRREIREWGEHNHVNVHTVQIIMDESARHERAVEPLEQRSDDELVRAYAKRQGLNKTTLKVGLKLMGEV